MTSFPRMIAGLVLASLGMDAGQARLPVGADALRTMEATIDSIASVEALHGRGGETEDLNLGDGGYDSAGQPYL